MARSESPHRQIGRLIAGEAGDSEEEQRQPTQHGSEGQEPVNETHGTYLDALTGSTYSTLRDILFIVMHTDYYRLNSWRVL